MSRSFDEQVKRIVDCGYTDVEILYNSVASAVHVAARSRTNPRVVAFGPTLDAAVTEFVRAFGPKPVGIPTGIMFRGRELLLGKPAAPCLFPRERDSKDVEQLRIWLSPKRWDSLINGDVEFNDSPTGR